VLFLRYTQPICSKPIYSHTLFCPHSHFLFSTLPQTYLNDIVLIDLEHYTGTTVNVVENQLPTPVTNASITAVGNKCFVFGGTDLKNACYNDIRALDVGHYLSSTDITVGEGASSEYSFKILIIGDAGEQ